MQGVATQREKRFILEMGAEAPGWEEVCGEFGRGSGFLAASSKW
jgi:hypothetical protein